MNSSDEALNALARHFGVLEEFRDLSGNIRTSSRETKLALLRANGLEIDTDRMIHETLSALAARDTARRCPSEVVIERGRPARLGFGAGAEWHVELDDNEGTPLSGRAKEAIELPALPAGVHNLIINSGGRQEEVTIIAAPGKAPILPQVAGRDRIWGLTTALYGLRSERSYGLGDFADLVQAAAVFGRAGAGFIGINPVHALGWADEHTISPYSPSHRSFLNAFHIAADKVFKGEMPEAMRAAFQSEGPTIAALRAAETLDYAGFKACQGRLLKIAFDHFDAHANPHDQAAFASYRSDRGSGLERFALYEAISETRGADWRDWPTELRNLAGNAVTASAQELKVKKRFHAWMQWVADNQLASAKRQAKASGMALGLYLDLAVGARRGGAETWCLPEVIARGVSIGAPPDHLSPAGQNWNLAAFAPEKLRKNKYRAFRETLAESMRHAGVLRIDHVLGLNRSFWIPDDGSPGGYIRQPFEALLAIVAIEADRAGTVVIGEDLGLVPDRFRETLAERGLYSYSVLQYEKDADGHFRKPETLRPQSLACFGTHDTPTLKGFWKGRDVDWWRALGWVDEAKAAELKQGREREKADLLALDDRTRPPSDQFGAVSHHIHSVLGRSPAAMVSVQLDDVLGYCEAQNLPGTIDEHPNWRRRCKLPLEDLAADPRVTDLGQTMQKCGRGKLPAFTREEVQ